MSGSICAFAFIHHNRFEIKQSSVIEVVTGRTRCEASGSICKLLFLGMVITGRVEQTANRYIEGKTEEYSSKQAWPAIGVQYPRVLTEGVIQVREQ